MCGIFGIIKRSTGEFLETSKIVDEGLSAIRHRGPDGSGQWIDGSNQVGLGHVRLAILDVKSGYQPMHSTCERYTIVYNGEVYNFLELREELGCQNFTTTCDTEVILKAYERWGADCVEKFRGMFAFAIWDDQEKSLFLGRDRFGIKPLYIFENKSGFYFSSELKGLLPFLEKLEVNKDVLSDYFICQLPLNDQTLLSGAKQLEPGHIAKYSIADGLKVERFWDIHYTINEKIEHKNIEEKIVELLHESVDIHLRSDVEVGSYISGGTDSSLVASLAKLSKTDKPMKGFNGRFLEGLAFDESRYARMVADANDIELFVTDITENDFIDNITKVIWHLDQPMAGPGSFSQYMVSQDVSKHVKVVLGGQGGDEIFGGYARYLISYLEKCIKASIEGNNELQSLPVEFKSIISNLGVLGDYKPMIKTFWSAGLFEDDASRYWRLINRAETAFPFLDQGVLDPEGSFSRFQKTYNAENVKGKHAFNSMLQFDSKILLSSLLQVEDRMSMAHGVEARVPLLDHELVEFVATLPEKIKFKDGNLKPLLKAVASKYLPAEVVNRKDKMGFPTPINHWIKDKPAVKEFVGDLFSSAKARGRPYLNNGFSVDKLLLGEGAYGRSFWGLLNLEIWHNHFVDKAPH